ncbi:MAG: HAD family hydrolase [Anderseniella sp.]
MNLISGILFDKDGVFVDFEKTWAPVIHAMAVDLSMGDESLSSQLLDIAGYDRIAGVFLPGSVWGAGHADDLMEVWKPLLPAVHPDQLLVRITDHCLRASAQPVFPLEKTREIFSGLSAGDVKLGVATNDVTASAVRTVAEFGLSHLFDVVLGYDAVANPKPAGDPVLEFAARTGIRPTQIMMVGDNLHDMQCGRAGGAGQCVGVLSGNSSRADLEKLADHVIDDISQLPGLLAELGS